MPTPVLVVLGGLPATGKSTIARALLGVRPFAFVRIDTVEQALRDAGELGPGGLSVSGYAVGYALASDLLAGGVDVLVECVNPLTVTRTAWRDVAASRSAGLVEVELFCGDAAEHRARVEHRTVDIPGLPLPCWAEIAERPYEPWPDAAVRIDTARTDPAASVALILDAVRAASARLR